MCGRLTQYRGIHDFVETLSLPESWHNNVGDQALERYNVAPSTPVAVLRMGEAGLRADLVKWGWRPHWATDRAPPINARVEKVAHGPFFRAIWPSRAITPVDGWFEWVDEGGSKKQPYYIRRRDGRPSLCASMGQFVGNEHDGFVIITADAQGGMVDVHDRRPVVLSPSLPASGSRQVHPWSKQSKWRCSLARPPRPSSGIALAQLLAMCETKGGI